MDAEYSCIPDYTLETLKAYVEEGRPTGDFLRAVLENNLAEAVGRADRNNYPALRVIIKWLFNHAPASCWGTPSKVLGDGNELRLRLAKKPSAYTARGDPMIAVIEKLTILADEDATISVDKFADANIRPYTVSIDGPADGPELDIQLTGKQVVSLLQALIHLLCKQLAHTCIEEDLICPLCGEMLEETVGVMGDEPAVGIRCPRGCDLEEVYL